MTPLRQTWDPDRYSRNARFVSDLGAPVLELLAPKPGEQILDIGCGDGELTVKIAASGCRVVGIDSSPAQVEAARRRGLEVHVMDAEHLPFKEEFDAVFSNAALHWMKNPDVVIEGVWRALKEKGRFVAEFGGYGCVATIAKALYAAMQRRGIDGDRLNPWYFPTVEDYGRRLESHGFEITWIALIPRPTPLPGDLFGWLETFAQAFTSALPRQEQSEFLREVQEELRPNLCDAEGKWTADYVRLRFAAFKKASRVSRPQLRN
jgi:trans-aconitate methyltransferase